MADGTIEIITGRERRRRWSTEEKLRIVAESHESGACVKAVAARHDVYPSLVFNWRRQVREGRMMPARSTGFVPVRMTGSVARSEQTAAPVACDGSGTARIEVVLPDGSRIYIGQTAQLPLLRGVVAALRG